MYYQIKLPSNINRRTKYVGMTSMVGDPYNQQNSLVINKRYAKSFNIKGKGCVATSIIWILFNDLEDVTIESEKLSMSEKKMYSLLTECPNKDNEHVRQFIKLYELVLHKIHGYRNIVPDFDGKIHSIVAGLKKKRFYLSINSFEKNSNIDTETLNFMLVYVYLFVLTTNLYNQTEFYDTVYTKEEIDMLSELEHLRY